VKAAGTAATARTGRTDERWWRVAGVSAELADQISQETYIWGYPLVLMEVTRRVMTNYETPTDVPGQAPLNQFNHAKTFPPASFRAVVRPNFDTLYSVAWLDLDPEPLVMTLPRTALDELAEKWGQRYGAIIRLWENAWEEFIPFLDYDIEIRRVICSTNAIESLNARYRRAVKARGHFPTEQAALKCLYLVTRSLDPTGTGQAWWTMRWKPALNAFAITFSDRFPAAEAY
jgi:hypothetical protein